MNFSLPRFALAFFVAFGATGAASPLPPDVRALLPKGATSLLVKRLPIGLQGEKRLVHIWGALRPIAAQTSYNKFHDSPLCVDVFAPKLNSNRWNWELQSSAAFVDSNPPSNIVAHFLRPAQKRGCVLEIISGNGAPGVSTRHTLLVWEKDFSQTHQPPVPQVFGSGGSGGGLISQRFDGVDERGFTTVTSRNTFGGKEVSTEVSRWDGERFVLKTPAK